MMYELNDSSDVTLASNDVQSSQPVCKYHKFGHCKFGQSCRKMHIDIKCTKPNCDRKSCLNRHPRPCKFFTVSGFCKWGVECSYSHHQPVSTPVQKEIDDLKITLKIVLEDLAQKENIIQKLQENVNNLLASNFTTRIETTDLNSTFKCDECSFSTNNNHGLKVHIGKSHKSEVLREDKSQFKNSNMSETLLDERKEHTESRLSNSFQLRPDLNICNICNINFEKIDNVKSHMRDNHGLLVRCDSCYSCGEVVPES